MNGDELDFVEWLRGRQRAHRAVRLGIGDDMAILTTPPVSGPDGKVIGQPLCLASDMLLDGVHFDAKRQDPALIGRKAIACNLSDCAAMAVRPLAATLSIALSPNAGLSFAQEVLQGAFGIAEEYDLAIVGGDTTRWPHPMVIDVAIAATPYPGIEPVGRGGAGVGDVLFVTGPLGGSLFARHLTFTPRVKESRVLAQALGGRLHAMIDLSDGLSLDLWRLCEASKVGAILDEHQMASVVSDDAKAAAGADGRSPLEHALTDGEDYELLVAVSPEVTGPPEGLSLYPVGRVTESGLAMRRTNGRTEPLKPKGYVH